MRISHPAKTKSWAQRDKLIVGDYHIHGQRKTLSVIQIGTLEKIKQPKTLI